jgi:DNA helicase II / ATP-dependent DNA helicase PcrA
LLAEGIARLRAGKVIREAGYDGEYGVIRLFADDELKEDRAGGLLFERPDGDRAKTDPLPPIADAKVRGRAAAEHRSLVLSASFECPLPRPHQDAGDSGALAGLDEDQRAAASVVESPLLIVAGPGSGKTRTLVHRIVHLIAEGGVPGAGCLAITFTRRAATEMRERLRGRLGADASAIPIHTFHSLGLTMLREHANAAGLQRGFRVADEGERVAALAAALNLPRPRTESLIRAIGKCERTEIVPTGEVAEARAAYRAMLTANNWIDFDDLVALAVRLLANNADVAALYRDRFRCVLVDEFQDVDQRQYRLVTELAPPPKGNLCVIGDPHQAIYGFRGADAACFDRFRRDYPRATTVALRRNYRSSGTIIAASAQVIAAQRSEPIAEMVRERRERITIHAAPSARAEAEFVVATIEQAIGGASFFSIDSGRAGGHDAAFSFADFAVLYRTEAQAAPLCEAFVRSGIPFRKHSHSALAHAPAVRTLLNALATSASDGDLAARLRRAAGHVAANNGERAASDLALQRLLPLAESCGGDEARFRDVVALARDADFWDERAEGVALLTLHAAKGLEFACVFIVGLEDGVLPLHWGKQQDIAPEDFAQERRLFYVGMTRAKDRLVLSRALKRLWHGRERAQTASPFIADIESELLKQQQADLRYKRSDRQLKLL